MAVFYRQDLDIRGSAELSKINELSIKLEELKKQVRKNPEVAEEVKRTREELLGLRREFNRTKQFTEATKSKVAEGKNNLDSISAADLMRIDKELSSERRGEFLSKSFLYKRVVDGENITEEPTDGKNLKEGDTLFVDFGKNRSAESKIGVGDFLSTDIKVVQITDINGRTRIGKRSIQGNKVGYYDENGYIPVFNGSIITIPKASEVEKYLKESNPNIKLSDNIDEENSAKDAFIKISERYDQLDEGFAPWNILEKQKFQKEATEIAKDIESKYGIPWQVTYGQATLETGYGKRAPNNNYFGIKGPSGGTFKTKEEVNGVLIETTASFRGYSSMRESFEDYAKLLTTNSRYSNAFKYKDNPEQFITEIISAGYATDSAYVEKIKQIWNSYDKIKDFKIDTPELIGKTTPEQLIGKMQQYIGTEYKWGGNSEYGIDCSHLVSKGLIDAGAASPNFYRVAAGLRDITPIKPITGVEKGDLLFWHTNEGVTHVAIVLGKPENGNIPILDASGKSSGLGKVAERIVPLNETKLSAGTPPFYI